MRVAGAVLLVLAVSAAACGGVEPLFSAPTGPSPGDTTTTSTPGPTTSPPADRFPPEVVSSYLEGCTEEADPAFCRCTIEQFEQRLTLNEFLDLSFAAGSSESPVVLEVTDLCLRQTGGPATTSTSTTAPPRELTIDELITLTIDDLEAFWSERLPDAYGRQYESIGATIPYFPSTGDLPSCGPETLPPEVAADNAFYCEPEDYVAWDAEGLIPDLYTEFGDFAISLVMAHEWGHVIQARGRVSGPTILTELQADCFAGAWTGAVEAGERSLRLEPGDLEEAMAGYLLFRDPVGTRPSDPGAHGSAFDRVAAFQEGFFSGVATCVDYEQGDYDVVDIPLTTQDLQTGGDLPFDDVEPLLTGSLEAYWELTFPELFGSPWEPVSDAGPYFPSSGVLPSCGGEEPDPGAYENNAFYCAAEDFVAWDGETLLPDLYQSIGDFAVGMVLGHEWATAAQARAGLPIEGVEASLQADCFTGAWSAAMVPFDNPTEIVLSPGDLDEAVSGFLDLSDDPGGDPIAGTAFERFDAFREGFFGGAAACLE